MILQDDILFQVQVAACHWASYYPRISSCALLKLFMRRWLASDHSSAVFISICYIIYSIFYLVPTEGASIRLVRPHQNRKLLTTTIKTPKSSLLVACIGESNRNTPSMSATKRQKTEDGEALPTFCRHEPMVIGDDTTVLLDHFLVPKHYEGALDSLMIPYGTIISRVDKLAHDIIKDYDGRTIHMLCVLKGAEKFFHDLCASIRAYHAFQDHGPIIPFVFDFVRVSSYSGMESTGDVQISGMDVAALRGEHVLIVEDIIDTGVTMTKLIAKLERDIHPASVRVAALLEKRSHLSNGFKGDYVAFSVPDKFIVGYGLDYNEVFRDLGHIAVMNQAGIEKYKEVKKHK